MSRPTDPPLRQRFFRTLYRNEPPCPWDTLENLRGAPVQRQPLSKRPGHPQPTEPGDYRHMHQVDAHGRRTKGSNRRLQRADPFFETGPVAKANQPNATRGPPRAMQRIPRPRSRPANTEQHARVGSTPPREPSASRHLVPLAIPPHQAPDHERRCFFASNGEAPRSKNPFTKKNSGTPSLMSRTVH